MSSCNYEILLEGGHREYDKMGAGVENEMDVLSNMYNKIESIDDLVSNEVVEKIIKGEPVADFLRFEEGLNISIEDFMNFDLDEVRDLGDGAVKATTMPNNTEEPLDYDFSDFIK